MLKLIGVSFILAVIQISESAPVYQFLPPREGYVPVYIRLGDTPLDEINPELALAFHESNIHTRNANDLEEQMVNDAPNLDFDSDVEDSSYISEENHQINTQSSEEREKVPDPEALRETEKESEEVTKNIKEEPTLINLNKNDSDEEIVMKIVTKKPTSDDQSSEEVTKGKRGVWVAPSTEVTTSDSSEEKDVTVVETKTNSSNESKSSDDDYHES